MCPDLRHAAIHSRVRRMTVAPLSNLPAVLREKATEFRNFGVEGSAKTIEWCADQVEQALQGHEQEALTITEASIESGYTSGTLRRLHRHGKMPMEANGTVLRKHLPRKPGHGVVASTGGHAASSRSQLACAVAEGGSDA